MNVLFITAYYPPCQYGWGFMRICEMAADGLHERGHNVAVLTSHYRNGPESKPYPVDRSLSIDPDWLLPRPPGWQFFVGRRARARTAVNRLTHWRQQLQPDVIFLWDIIELPRPLLHAVEAGGAGTAVYYLANYAAELPDPYWQFWSQPPQRWAARLLKRPLRQLALAQLEREGYTRPLRYERTIAVSDFVRQRLQRVGAIGADAVVAYNGIETDKFFAPLRERVDGRPLQALIAGRLAPEKGIPAALTAFGELRRENQLADIQLNIVGDGPAAYKQQLQRMIADLDVGAAVTIRPPVAASEMPGLLAAHDLLLLPSEWDEPLSCSMLEAMAAGLLVVATPTGGSAELLRDGENSLLFPPGDGAALAQQLRQVCRQPEIVSRLAAVGQQLVLERFDIRQTIDQIEQYLNQQVTHAK
jgi:glycosyltransferase involved in cell wall biosynthesis